MLHDSQFRCCAKERIFRLILGLALVGSLGACGLLPRISESEPELAPAPVTPPEPEVEAESAGSLVDALQWIEAGEFERAAKRLEQLQQEQPGAPTVNLLLRQLREPPELLLPGPYGEVLLAAGESLSAVAERELGNPLYFVALARLNAIAQPRRVAAGTVLRVPREMPGRTALASDSELESVPSAQQIEKDLLTIAEYLVASEQLDQAVSILYATLQDRGGSIDLQTRFVELGLDRVEDLRARQHHAVAMTWIRDARAVVTDPMLAERLRVAGREFELDRLLEQADVAGARGDLDAAFAAARQARQLAPDDARAEQLEQALATEWTLQLHAEALRSWRQRDVDQAIRLWQQLLENVPDFEPARVYLDRALELRRRLQ